MRTVYRALALLTALGVAVQAAAIAWGMFTMISDVEGGAVIDSSFDPAANTGLATHSMGAMVVAVLSLLLLIVSLLNRFAGAKKWAAATFAAVVLQWVFGILAFSVPGIGILHGANALAILVLALLADRAARHATEMVPTAVRPRAPVRS